MNSLYRDILLSRAKATIGASTAVAALSHAPLKGLIREILVRDLLRPLLPMDIGIGSGQVISAHEEASTQQDVVLFDRRVVPSVVFEEATGIFPVEAVLFTIEVKTRLTLENLRMAHESARALLAFQHVPGIDDLPLIRDDTPREAVIPCLVAFDSDLSVAGKSELARYDEIRGAEAPCLRALCVVGRGFWFWEGDCWRSWTGTEPGYELLRLMTIILNVYQRVASTRLRPDLTNYVFPAQGC